MSNVITLPDSIVEQIDRIVGEHGRDQFVRDALDAELRRRRLEAFEAAVGSLSDVDVPGWETPESTDRWVREQRGECEESAKRVPGDDL
jgi:hypothetical protein